MNAASRLAVGSLFTGCGGLDAGVLAALRGARLAWVADCDPAASQVLSRAVPGVPNHGDVTRIAWDTLPPVDVLTAGWPCQDISAAGGRAGIEHGARSGLWRTVVTALTCLHPAVVVLENVAALRWRGGGLGRVLADLAATGYECLWTTLAASGTGAPHLRERVFLLGFPAGHPPRTAAAWQAAAPVTWRKFAVLPHTPTPGAWPRGGGDGPWVRAAGTWPRQGWVSGSAALTPASPAPPPRPGRRLLPTPQARDHHGAQHPAVRRAAGRQVNLNDVACSLAGTAGAPTGWGPYETAVRQWEHVLGRPAPAPAVPGRRGQPRMNEELPEFLMGLPRGHVTATPGLTYRDKITALGNGAVPQQAAAAVRSLLRTAGCLPSTPCARGGRHAG